MTLATLGLAALLTSPTASADESTTNRSRAVAGHEVSLELGTLAAPDPDWEYLGSGNQISSHGVRAGWGFTPMLALVASWHRGADGVEFDGPVSDDTSGGEENLLFRTSFISHQLALGPKLQWRVTPWLAPYATLQGLGVLGTARLDDGFDDDDNPNQYTYRGLAPGGFVSGGVDVKPVRLAQGMRLGTHIELGYALTGRMRLVQEGGRDPASTDEPRTAQLGAVGFRGFTMRFGVGVNF